MRWKLPFIGFVLLCFCLKSNAQFEKGDKMVGASIIVANYNTGNADVSFPQGIRGYTSKNTSYNVNFNPSAGWFISENTVAGFVLNINPYGQKSRYEDVGTAFQQDKSSNFNIGAGGFARRYIKNSGSFLPFGQVGFNAGISSMNTDGFRYFTASPNYKNTYTGKSSGGFFANAALVLGITKLISDYTGIDLFVGYLYSYSKNTMKTTTQTDLNIDGTIDETEVNQPTTKFTNHGFTLGIGYQVFLARKKK